MPDKPLLRPMNDFVFKKLFTEHTDLLTDLLMTILDLPAEEYQGLVVVDPYLRREVIEDKQSILDVKIKTKTQKVIDVEVQVQTQPAIWKRMQYYNGVMYAGQIKSGNDYGLLTKAIGILIADFPLIDDAVAHHRFVLHDPKNRTDYPDSNEIHMLEVPKAGAEENSVLKNWLSFFAAQTSEEFMTASVQNPAVAQAYGIIKTLSADEETRLVAESREKGRRDYMDRLNGAMREGMEKGMVQGMEQGIEQGMAQGMAEGMEQGRKEGREEGRRDVARIALAEGMSAESIARFTGLSPSEIEGLRNL